MAKISSAEKTSILGSNARARAIQQRKNLTFFLLTAEIFRLYMCRNVFGICILTYNKLDQYFFNEIIKLVKSSTYILWINVSI